MTVLSEPCMTLESDYGRIKCAEQFDPDGAIALCKAIIFKMIEDYRTCTKYMEVHAGEVDSKKFVKANKRKKEIESFVRSKLFCSMIDINGKQFLEMVKQKFNT